MNSTKNSQFGSAEIRWDLSDIYAGPNDPQIEADMVRSRKLAQSFSARFKGRIASLSAVELAEALAEYEAIVILINRIGQYVYLVWSVDTGDQALGQLMAKSEEHWSAVQQEVLFFELEWANAPVESAALANDPLLAEYRHFLETERLNQPYTRSEPEEQIMSQLSLSGGKGWHRYYSEVMSKAVFHVGDEEMNQAQALNLLTHPDRERRQIAAQAISETLVDSAHAATFTFNMTLLEKASHDKIRGYKQWISQRNLSNQVADEMVEALVSAVSSRYDLVARYYQLLRQQLGLDQLYDYDRYAPLEGAEADVDWPEAERTVLAAFAGFDEQFSATAKLFFDRGWIDAPPQQGKMGGAYCMPMTVDSHPYLFLNYNGKMGDVMTLAHELGHGIHAYLSRSQRQLQMDTPITIAEMASTFGEMLVFEHLIEKQPDPKVRFSMRMKKMTDTIATIFRQLALNRFEHAIHETRRRDGELTSDQLADIWMETQEQMYGGEVELRDEYRLWWSYISHFIAQPGYVYGYAFGELLVWALYAAYKESPAGFAERYMLVLRSGGSDWPHALLAPMGVDLQDPAFWDKGLGLIDEFMSGIEADAKEL